MWRCCPLVETSWLSFLLWIRLRTGLPDTSVLRLCAAGSRRLKVLQRGVLGLQKAFFGSRSVPDELLKEGTRVVLEESFWGTGSWRSLSEDRLPKKDSDKSFAEGRFREKPCRTEGKFRQKGS